MAPTPSATSHPLPELPLTIFFHVLPQPDILTYFFFYTYHQSMCPPSCLLDGDFKPSSGLWCSVMVELMVHVVGSEILPTYG